MTSGTNWEHAHKWFVKSVKINITLSHTEKIAEADLRYVFKLAFPASLLTLRLTGLPPSLPA